MAMNRGVGGWTAALLLALTVAASPVMADEAKPDKSFKQEVKEGAKETWKGFKEGLKDTGRAIKDTGKAIKEDAKESAREVKKDLKD
jgi:hypothetical protein